LSAPIVVTGLDHAFGAGETRKQVLFGINLTVTRGALTVLMGPSGSGKTTLLTLMGCLRAVQTGSVRLLGAELKGAGPLSLEALPATNSEPVARAEGILPRLQPAVHTQKAWRGSVRCHKCRMHGPSSQTGPGGCEHCGLCSTCCAKPEHAVCPKAPTMALEPVPAAGAAGKPATAALRPLGASLALVPVGTDAQPIAYGEGTDGIATNGARRAAFLLPSAAGAADLDVVEWLEAVRQEGHTLAVLASSSLREQVVRDRLGLPNGALLSRAVLRVSELGSITCDLSGSLGPLARARLGPQPVTPPAPDWTQIPSRSRTDHSPLERDPPTNKVALSL
jgi:energy-coupling factor transporter ATP-binding protein EcfA2